MSGFHPVLGLLAVAVCISFAKGAAFSYIVNDDAPAIKFHESNADKPLFGGKYNDAPARSLNQNGKHASLSADKDHRDEDIITGRNAEYNNRASGFGGMRNLETARENGLSLQAAAADTRSGDINDESSGKSGLVEPGENRRPELSHRSQRSSDEQRTGNSGEGQTGSARMVSEHSGSEEDCEDGDNLEQSNDGTETTTSHSPTGNPSDNNQDQDFEEECDEKNNPGSESSSTQSPSQTQETEEPESEECEETDEPIHTDTPTTSTSTTKQPKHPEVDPGSSGSFGDTDEDGLQLSNSKSDEGLGDNTDISSWKR